MNTDQLGQDKAKVICFSICVCRRCSKNTLQLVDSSIATSKTFSSSRVAGLSAIRVHPRPSVLAVFGCLRSNMLAGMMAFRAKKRLERTMDRAESLSSYTGFYGDDSVG